MKFSTWKKIILRSAQQDHKVRMETAEDKPEHGVGTA
jgi:hypothetical protein